MLFCKSFFSMSSELERLALSKFANQNFSVLAFVVISLIAATNGRINAWIRAFHVGCCYRTATDRLTSHINRKLNCTIVAKLFTSTFSCVDHLFHSLLTIKRNQGESMGQELVNQNCRIFLN